MALNDRYGGVERLAADVARLTGETKIEAIRQPLLERRQRLAYRVAGDRTARARQFLEDEVWPLVPASEVGRRLTRRQEDTILGYPSDAE